MPQKRLHRHYLLCRDSYQLRANYRLYRTGFWGFMGTYPEKETMSCFKGILSFILTNGILVAVFSIIAILLT